MPAQRRIVKEEQEPNPGSTYEGMLNELSSVDRDMHQEEHKEKLMQENSIQNFMVFLDEEIANLKKYSSISVDPTFAELNEILAHHEGVLLGIISSYELMRTQLKLAQRDYNQQFAHYYTLIRERENTKDLSAQKYLGQKEIEYILLDEHAQDLKPLEDKVIFFDRKTSTLRRLIDSWSAFSYTLNTLSKNTQAEVLAHLKDTSKTLAPDTVEDIVAENFDAPEGVEKIQIGEKPNKDLFGDAPF